MKSPSSNGLRSGGVELKSSNKSSVTLVLLLTGSLSVFGIVDSLGDDNDSVERSVACEPAFLTCPCVAPEVDNSCGNRFSPFLADASAAEVDTEEKFLPGTAGVGAEYFWVRALGPRGGVAMCFTVD